MAGPGGSSSSNTNSGPSDGVRSRGTHPPATSDTAVTVVVTDATHPSVQAILILDSVWADEALLSKTQNNWNSWKARMLDMLILSKGLKSYLDNSAYSPDPETEPCAMRNHILNDNSVHAYIRTKLTKEELLHVKSCTSAKMMWDTLKDRHEKQGPILQILLIQEALTI
ncbi:hypothetical protein BD779DRAFT_1469524 [Infundibulicybe gibba]|nr:hypothetical protein BD779DRAFT_1469524 [Infundibulicybe gibba]